MGAHRNYGGFVMLSTRINMPDDLKEKFRKYCSVHNITMTKLLLDGALSIVESRDLPGKEKNSVVYCPYCGKDINS